MNTGRLLEVFCSGGYGRRVGHTTYHIHEVFQLCEIGDLDIVYLSYSDISGVAARYMRDTLSWAGQLGIPAIVVKPNRQLKIGGTLVHFMTYDKYIAWRAGRGAHYLVEDH